MIKPTLKFISSYEISLYHFVDKFVIWDRIVSPTFKEYLDERYELNEEDQGILDALYDERSKLGWSEEILLHEWAAAGSPDSPKYSAIKKAIQHFEIKPNRQGGNLKSALNQAQPKIDVITAKLQNKFDKSEIKKEIELMQELIGYTPELNELPAFIVPSPTLGNYQGEANGDGITVEVYPEDGNIDRAFALVVHEYAHKAFDASHYFENLDDQQEREFFSKKDDKVSLNTFSAHMEELIVRSVVDVHLMKDDPNVMAQRYHNRGTNRLDLYGISWEHVNYIAPIVISYLDGELTIEDTRTELVEAFRTKVVNHKLAGQ